MAEEEGSALNGGVVCCCLIIALIFALGVFSSGSDDTTSDIVEEIIPEEAEHLDIINSTNLTLDPKRITFVYYDHNTSKFNGCYGLNYTVLTERDGTEYMLDHATTDILGEKTNYTFKNENGIGIIYDNNTDTEIYKNMSYYYVHGVYLNDTIIKSVENFTLHDKSHEPQIIPTDWLFVYKDHNSTEYEGDYGLVEIYANNSIGNKERNIRWYRDDEMISLAYASNRTFDYRYGLSNIYLEKMEIRGKEVYTANSGSGSPEYPNGTKIESFDMETLELAQNQKEFLDDYWGRIDDVRFKQQLDAIDRAESDLEHYYSRTKDRGKNYSYYTGTNGYGFIYSL